MARKSLIIRSQRQPKYTTRLNRRCKICGRPKGYMRAFQMCRICFRNLASKGMIPGVRKSSW